MKILIFIFGILFFQLFYPATGQNWIRTYGNAENTVINNVFEHYDQGYLFSGERYNQGYTAYGLMLKTDINGNERWS